jgi:hypothetical protein
LDETKGDIESHLRRILCDLASGWQDAREAAQKERVRVIREQEGFLQKHLPLLSDVLARGRDVDPWQIEPELALVETQKEKDLARLLVLAWWSMPYAEACGRRFTLLIRDRQNGRIMGLASFASPILAMEARDRYLGVTKENRPRAVNLGLNGFRVGALPPYDRLLGGKLAAMVLASREVREIYEGLYGERSITRTKGASPPKLVYVYTTGAYGRASIYERLRDRKGNVLAIYIGETKGYGVMHVSDDISDLLAKFFDSRGIELVRRCGQSSSRLRRMGKVCRLLGVPDVTFHGHKRAIYLFPHVANLREAIAGEEPQYIDTPFAELASWWKERWAIPRALRALQGEVADWRTFVPEDLIQEVWAVLRGANFPGSLTSCVEKG